MVFDKRQTNIAKGVALLLLLWHHLFYNSPEYYEKFVSLFSIKGIPAECYVAVFCKVCVSIFLFLSGYGLFKSYTQRKILCNTNNMIKRDISFVKNHLLKMMSSYWIIYVIFLLVGLLINSTILNEYNGNVIYAIIDFFGLAYLFGTPTINATWWFMSVIIIFYLVSPFMIRLLKWSPEITLLLSIALIFCPYFIDLKQLNVWLSSFVLGMYFANNDGFYFLDKRFDQQYKKFLFSLFFIILLAFIRNKILDDKVTIDFLFGLSIIIFSYFFISKIPIVNIILEELGKYSGLIFMFHTFIYSFYFRDFIYWFKYSIVIYIVMVVLCYIIARLLSWLMKVTRYNRLIDKLIKI